MTRAIPKDVLKRMLDLYASGMRVKDIAEVTGHSISPVYKVLRQAGTELRVPVVKRRRHSILARARGRIGVW